MVLSGKFYCLQKKTKIKCISITKKANFFKDVTKDRVLSYKVFWKTDKPSWINSFVDNDEKRPNILQKSYNVNTARFSKYVWQFFIIINESCFTNQYWKQWWANHQLKQALRKREKLELANYADIKADYAKFISVYKKHHSTPFLGLAKNWAEYPHQNKFAGPVPMYPVHLCMPSLSFTWTLLMFFRSHHLEFQKGRI